MQANQLPWQYLPTWFLISLPEFYFVVLLVGIALAVKSVRGAKFSVQRRDEAIQIGFLVFAFLFPIAVAILTGATLYDGMRHFLFVLPVLTVLAGISFVRFLRSSAIRPYKQVVAGLVVGSLALTLVDMIQLHPYEYVFFNRLIAGGLPKAAGRFETDYWGNSYKEGLEWVTKNYYPVTSRKHSVANCSVSSRFMTAYPIEQDPELRDRYVAVNPDDHPDILLAITRWGCNQRPGKVLHVVERQGTPLLYVIETQVPRL